MGSITLEPDNKGEVEVVNSLSDDIGIDEKAGVDATSAVNAVSRGKAPLQAYRDAVSSKDYEGALAAYMDVTARNRIDDIETSVGNKTSEDVASELINLDSNITGMNGIAGVEEEGIATNPASLQSPPEALAEEKWVTAYRNEGLGKYASQFDNESLLEKIKTVVGTVIPFRDNSDYYNVLNEAGYDLSLLDASLFSGSSKEKFRNFFQGQSKEAQLAIFKSINDQMDMESDNPILRADLIKDLFGLNFFQAGENLENIVDAVSLPLDVAAIAKGGANIASNLGDAARNFNRFTTNFTKKSNIINTGNRLKSPETTARLIEGALADPKAAANVGVRPANVMDAQDITIPKSAIDLLTGASESTASAVSNVLKLQKARKEELLDALKREGLMSEQDIADLEARLKIKYELKDNVEDNSFEVEVLNDLEYKIKYNKVNMDDKGNVISTEPVEVKTNFLVKDVRGLVDASNDWEAAFLRRDPNSRAKGQTKNMFVSSMERIAPQQAMFNDTLDTIFRDAYKGQGLNAKDEAAVAKVLELGHKAGTQYTFEELVDAGVGANSTRLTEKQAKGYIAHRNAMDIMFDLQNTLVSERLAIQGVKIAELGSQAVNTIPYDSVDTAASVFIKHSRMPKADRGSPYIMVFGDDFADWTSDGLITSNFKAWTKEDWNRVYNSGYKLVRNHNSSQFFKNGNNRTQWALVKEETLYSPLGKAVLNKIPGYMPVQRQKARYFIRQKKKGQVSGSRDFETTHTVAYSDNIRDAEAWVARQDGDYTIDLDRQLSDRESLYANSAVTGGMYTGKRSSKELEFVGKDGRDQFADSMEGVSGYINQISKQYPISIFRDGAEARAIATAKSLGVDAKTLDGLIDHESLPRASAQVKGVLKDIHAQVSMLKNIPTESERRFSQKVTNVAKALDRKLGGKIDRADKMIDGVYSFGANGTQISDVIRGVTFRVMLGYYNPAQLLVQGSAATLAMSVNPTLAPQAMLKTFAWRMMDFAKTPAEREAMVKWHREKGLGDDWTDGYKMWFNSGLRESVRNSNASYEGNLTSRGPYDETFVKKVLQNDTIFYQMGELANTRVSFALAYEWYKKTNKLKTVSPDDVEAMRKILQRTEVYRLNMSRANQSDLNKGPLSVPLQFIQVMNKYATKILPQWTGGTEELTWQEKIRLFTLPTALFGAAGVPGFSYVANQVMESYGVDPSEVSEETAVALNDGIGGLIFNNILGFENDFSGRFSLAVNPFEFFAELMVQGGGWWNVGGPATSLAKRVARDMQYIGQAFSVVLNDESNSTTAENLLLVAEAIGDALIDFPTFTRNVNQYGAHVFGDNPSLVKNGITISRDMDLKSQTALAAIFGMNPQKPQELYAMKANSRKLKGGVQGAPNFLLTEPELLVRLLERGLSDKNPRSREVHMNAFQTILGNYGIIERQVLSDATWDLILDEKIPTGDIIMKVFRQQYDSHLKGVQLWEDLRVNGTLSKETAKRK